MSSNFIKKIQQITGVFSQCQNLNFKSLKLPRFFDTTINTSAVDMMPSLLNHPAKKVKSENLKIINYQDKIDFSDLFQKLKIDYGIERLTIQSGSTINVVLLRAGLIDHISLVVAPCLIGGKDTVSLIGGESLHNQEELKHVKALKLKQCDVLKDSYLHLQYDVVNKTEYEKK